MEIRHRYSFSLFLFRTYTTLAEIDWSSFSHQPWQKEDIWKVRSSFCWDCRFPLLTMTCAHKKISVLVISLPSRSHHIRGLWRHGWSWAIKTTNRKAYKFADLAALSRSIVASVLFFMESFLWRYPMERLSKEGFSFIRFCVCSDEKSTLLTGKKRSPISPSKNEYTEAVTETGLCMVPDSCEKLNLFGTPPLKHGIVNNKSIHTLV